MCGRAAYLVNRLELRVKSYATTVDLEYLVVEGGEFVEDGLDAAGLGVGEEDLAEAVAADEGDEALDAE